MANQAKKAYKQLAALKPKLSEDEQVAVAVPTKLLLTSVENPSEGRVFDDGLTVMTNKALHFVKAGRFTENVHERVALDEIENAEPVGMEHEGAVIPLILLKHGGGNGPWAFYIEEESKGLLEEWLAPLVQKKTEQT